MPIVTFGVKDPSARACEVLFTIAPGPTPEGDFGDGAKGVVQRRDTKLAVTFTATADAPIHSPISLLVPAGTAMMRLARVSDTCYDRSGRMIPGQGVDMQ